MLFLDGIHRFGGGFGAVSDPFWMLVLDGIHRFEDGFGAFLDPFWSLFLDGIHRFLGRIDGCLLACSHALRPWERGGKVQRAESRLVAGQKF